MYRLSVCAGTVLQKVPFEQRVKDIAKAGFLVDLWSWQDSAIDAIAADPDIEIGAIPGWAGGSMVHPDGVESFMEGVKANLDVALKLNCRHLSIASGELDERGYVVHPIAKHPATMWITAYKTLCQVAERVQNQLFGDGHVESKRMSSLTNKHNGSNCSFFH